MFNHVRKNWDRVAGWALVIAGGIALIIGWVGMSGTSFPADQLPYMMSGGVGGMFLLGLGSTLLLSGDLRDEWHKLDRIEQALSRTSGDEEAVLLPVQDDAA